MQKRMMKEKSAEKVEMAGRLYEIRKRRSLTQEIFSEKLGISLSAYKKLEAGVNQISLDTLRRLEKYEYGAAEYVLFGKRDKTDEAWRIIMNCPEEDKIRLLLSLLAYFTETRPGRHMNMTNQAGYDFFIDNFMKELKRKRNDTKYSNT